MKVYNKNMQLDIDFKEHVPSCITYLRYLIAHNFQLRIENAFIDFANNPLIQNRELIFQPNEYYF